MRALVDSCLQGLLGTRHYLQSRNHSPEDSTEFPFIHFRKERLAASEQLLESLFTNPEGVTQSAPSSTTREDYIERIVVGGFPFALARTTLASRNRWFDDYVRLTLERDVQELSKIRQASMLPRLLARLAGQTGQVLNITKAASDIGLDERTADGYLRLLEAVFLILRLPAWRSTLITRATAIPKLHVFDSGIAARLLRLTPEKLARRHPTAMTELGHLLETFVVQELAKQASWLDGLAGIGHWRTWDDDEVDLVVERDDGAVVAFEVKTAGAGVWKRLPRTTQLRTAVVMRSSLGSCCISVLVRIPQRTVYLSYPSTVSGHPIAEHCVTDL